MRARNIETNITMEENKLSSSFTNPCELVRGTCRTWIEDEGLELAEEDDGADIDIDVDIDINVVDVNIDVAGWNVDKGTPNGRRSVRLRLDKLPALADEIAAQTQRAKATSTSTTAQPESSPKDEDHYNDDPTTEACSSWIQWDEEGWHYSGEGFQGTKAEKRERIALYLLALDAINFCFWPLPESDSKNTNAGNAASTADYNNQNSNNLLEYEHLAMSMKKMAESDHGRGDGDGFVFSPQNLASMTTEKMTSLFDSCLDPLKYPLPNIRKRAQLWNEVGESLLANFHGSASALLDASKKDASKLVELVAMSFPGFRDEVFIPASSSSSSEQNPRRIVFLKRAQIFVGDINAALGLDLKGMERLTTFADYRVPQILRHWGVLEYSPCLASRVDEKIELERGSCDEISIRASTVVAVEELVGVLNQNQTTDENDQSGGSKGTNTTDTFTDVTVDWYLWQVGERMHQEGIMKPFHKVRTHFY